MIFKLPIALLQLRYLKTRLIVAIAGIAFAVVIVFMQFGLRDALFDSAASIPKGLAGDCFLISPRSTAMIALENFTERRLLQVLAFKDVEFISPIYIGFAQWKNPQTRNYWRNILIMGIDVRHQVVTFPGVQENIFKLKLPDHFLFDVNSRSEFGPIVRLVEEQGSVTTELSHSGSNRKIDVIGLFKLGTSFGSDGSLLTSHVNFLRIFGQRKKNFIDIGLIKLKPGSDVKAFTEKIKAYLPNDIKVFTKEELVDFEKKFWQSSTAIGFIFNLGVTLGITVGIVFVYQILYTNVSEHLSEYATLKAIGYRHQYLLSMVGQQALILSILGYIPGLLISILLYEVAHKATLLPIAMNLQRAILVLFLTIFMCACSGAIAVQKLKAADPADIF